MCTNAGGGSGGGGGAAAISAQQALRIKTGIESHSKAENDRAGTNMARSLKRAKEGVDNLETYIKLGVIKSASDQWYQEKVESYKSLKAQLEFFKQERRRQGR